MPRGWCIVLLAILCVVQSATVCTVGPSGQYSSIQAGLFSCNGASGDVQLIISPGSYVEPGLFFPRGLDSIRLTASNYGSVPVAPLRSQVAVLISGTRFRVAGPTTSLRLEGLGLDGMQQAQAMFDPPMGNNNLTMYGCHVANFTGSDAIRGVPCVKDVYLDVRATRFESVRGSAIRFNGLEDLEMDDNVYDKVGGYLNRSAVELKMSYVSRGKFIFTNQSHWLVSDQQTPLCIFTPDKNGMVQCKNGTMLCYNKFETAKRRPRCQQQTVFYTHETTNATLSTIDYPASCRIYTPCTCQTLLFSNGTETAELDLGDIIFYTGLRLNCTRAPGSTLLNSTNLTYVGSEAGQDGVGVAPLPGDKGWSMNATYSAGIINTTTYNTCKCAPKNNNTNTTSNSTLQCDYAMGNDLRCQQGVVNQCKQAYIRCFPSIPTNVTLPAVPGNMTRYCFSNGTSAIAPTNTSLAWLNMTLPPEFGNATICMPLNGTFVNGTLANSTALVLPNTGEANFTLGNYTCLGSFPPGSNFTVLSKLNLDVYETACNGTNSYCPLPTSNTSRAHFRTKCGNCTQQYNDTVDSVILITNVCQPYGCKRIATASCVYAYEHTWNPNAPQAGQQIDPVNMFNSFFWGHASSLSTDQMPDFFYTVNFTVEYDPSQPPPSLCPRYYTPRIFSVDRTDPNNPEMVDEPGASTAIYQALHQLQLDTDANTLNTIAGIFAQICWTNYQPNQFVYNGVGFCDWAQYANFTLANETLALLVPYPYTEASSACSQSQLTCVSNFTSTCPCDQTTISLCQTTYEISPMTAAYAFDNIHDKLSYVDMSNDRSQGLPVGAMFNRTNEYIIQNFTTVVFGDGFSSRDAMLRRFYNWDNSLITGTVHDLYYGVRRGSQEVLETYSYFCDGGCPQQYILESDFDCIVDGSTPEPKANKTYKLIQAAIDDNCGSVLVKNYENFYPENLIFRNRIHRIVSFESAKILGKSHEIRVGNLTIQGLHFYHPGDLSQPMFKLVSSMDSLNLLNLLLDGGGVRGGGVFQTDEDQPFIKVLTMNHTKLQFWNMVTFFVNNVETSIGAHNTFNNTYGRSIDIVYKNAFRWQHNLLNNVRGVSGMDGVSMVRWRAANELTGCSPQVINANIGPCVIREMIQVVDPLEEDYPDIGLSVVGGWIQPKHIVGNVISKASKGFELRRVRSIPSATMAKVVRNNPGIRPSAFRTTSIAQRRNVWDWTYDEYWNSPIFVYPTVRTSVECNYPCGLPFVTGDLQYCSVNPNYQAGLTPYFGIREYTNASMALPLCDTTRPSPYRDSLEVPIFFSGSDGGRCVSERITMNRTGASFYGWLVDDDEYVAPDCFPRSHNYEMGHLQLADNFTMCNMSYEAFGDNMQEAYSLWSNSNDPAYPVYNTNVTNNTINMGNITPYYYTHALSFEPGYDTSTWDVDKVRQGGSQPTEFAALRNSTFIARFNRFDGFAAYHDNIQLADGRVVNVSNGDYPYTDPIYVRFKNEKGPYGFCYIENNTFRNVDRRVCDIRYALEVNYTGNIAIDVGSRAFGNIAGVLIALSRNILIPRIAHVLDNIMTQSKPILSDRSLSTSASGYYASIVIRGGGNNSLICFKRNNISGGAIGVRFSGMTYFQLDVNDSIDLLSPAHGFGRPTILSCINVTANPPQYYDTQDPLRRIWFENNDTEGYIHDIVYGDSWEDATETWIYCSDGCPPPPPKVCNVSLTDPAINPLHPLWGTNLFSDLNLALANCVNDTIIVERNKNNESYVLQINPQLLPNSTMLNASMFRIMTVRAEYPGIQIVGCGHHIDQGRYRFEGFEFVHGSCLDPFAPTWDMSTTLTLNASTPRLIELAGNVFTGGNTTVLAIGGRVGDKFLLEKNTFQEYRGDVVEWIKGESCNVTFTSLDNTFYNCSGACQKVTELGGLVISGNNYIWSGGNSATENAMQYVALCNLTAPSAYSLIGRDNTYSQDNTTTAYKIVGLGYTTAFWYDPVQTQYLNSYSISGHRGTGLGVCLRQDRRPDTKSNYYDPQLLPREIALLDNNLYCDGDQFDIRLNNQYADGREGGNIAFDFVIQLNPQVYLGFFCNDGCGKTSDIQLGLFSFIVAAIGALLAISLFVWCVCYKRPTTYYEPLKGANVSIYGVLQDGQRMRVTDIDEDALAARDRQRAMAGRNGARIYGA